MLAQRALERVYAGLDPERSALADATLGKLRRAVWVIVAALVVYYGARSLGFGRIGVYACVALLVINAAAVSWLRVRWTRRLELGADVDRRVARAAVAQMLAAWLAFAGCAVYVLRP